MVNAATLLGVDSAKLLKCITIKTISTGNEVVFQPRSHTAAKSTRDGLARLLYARVFAWLIVETNKTLQLGDHNESSSELCVGVLDIAGFESFKFNSLEQLMINLSNEHLQQHFNQVIFKEEIEESKKENVQLPPDFTFDDNADILVLIDGRLGFYRTLKRPWLLAKALT